MSDRDAWDERYAASELVWSAGPNERFASEVASLSPGTALDVGAGEGRNAVWLAEQGWRVTAVDFSEVALAKARRIADVRGVELETVCADVREFLPAPGSFDLVAVIYLHLPGPLRTEVLRRAAGAVAPGGALVVLGHDSTNIAEGVGGPQDPAVLFTAADVVADIAGAGLDIVTAERITRIVDHAEGQRVALDALVRAHRPGS